jgi:hypothetical protein
MYAIREGEATIVDGVDEGACTLPSQSEALCDTIRLNAMTIRVSQQSEHGNFTEWISGCKF